MKAIHPAKRRPPFKVVDGNKFYEITLADEILHSRFMVAEVQELFISLGITQPFLLEVCELMKEQAMNVNDIKKLKENIMAIAMNIESRVGMLAEKKAYEEMACVYFMLEGEPVEWDDDWQTKKKGIWRAAGETDFFTLQAFKRIHELQDISTKDILNVWKAISERIKQLPPMTSTG